MNRPFRILIVDDQTRARRSLKALIATKFPQVEISEAANGADGFKSVTEFNPDVVLTDVVMPIMDGLTCTRLIKSTRPHTRVIVLTMYGDYKTSALEAGADAFISKGEPPEELLTTLKNFQSTNDGVAE